ncbi:MAG: helix-turn-helix transcriptional regulator, partial [Clostridia bacterium]|nr:helix-turn-helix transcriptional regulator [Clostridia bacterium]
MIDNARTGAFIAQLRQRAGMTQSQLANMMNVTHQAVSKWENGSALPDMQTMLNLSAVFGVTIEELLVVPDSALKNAGPAAVLAGEAPAPEMVNAELEGALERIEEEIGEALEEQNCPSGQPDDAQPACGQSEPQPDAAEEEPKVGAQKLQFDWDHIASMAPFLDKQTLAGIAAQAGDDLQPWHVEEIAPFLPKELLSELALKMAEEGQSAHLETIAPFVSKDVLGEIVEKQMQAGGIDWHTVESIVPFMRREQLDRIVRDLAERGEIGRIESIAPFVSKETLGDIVLRQKEKGEIAPESIAALAP